MDDRLQSALRDLDRLLLHHADTVGTGTVVVAKVEDMEDIVEDTAVVVPRFAGTTNKAVAPGGVAAGFRMMTAVAAAVATRIGTIGMKTGEGAMIEIGIELSLFERNSADLLLSAYY